ncbi:unnamed protein product [Ambrosiozyma monospora]|uniref:Unnamed protein product n=1 Tax=Ambrosiozyma monospora TaxID=43982 RepID=A0A9W6YWX0_AMBMO|nr:unnamed protein product [Ambrosiozyma monospora]
MAVKVPKYVIPGQPIVPILSTSSTPSTPSTSSTSSTSSTTKIQYEPGKNCRIDTVKHKGTNIPCIVSSVLGRVTISKVDLSSSSSSSSSAAAAAATSENNGKDKYNDVSMGDTGNPGGENVDVDVYQVTVVSKNDPSFNVVENVENVENVDVPEPTKFSMSTPSEHDIVLARVTKITTSRIHVEILIIESHSSSGSTGSTGTVGGSTAADDDGKIQTRKLMTNLIPAESGETFRGIIRSQDIRSTNRDTVQTWNCFQPGDIIKAEVISLGDGVNYYLSTAKDELGVIMARSAVGGVGVGGGASGGSQGGELMCAVDWEHMVGLNSGVIEPRKCAKPL